MKFSKLFFLFVLFFCGIQFCCAEDIRIASFDELINSAPENGDVLILTDNLTSDSSIGTYFNNLAVTFEGNNYYINGNNTFSGFNFNAETRFNQVDVRNCRGQRYGGYSYAGAIYNNGSELSIFRSAFDDNFVNASFDFYGKTMSGKQMLEERWKRALSTVNGSLGEAVGQMYVSKYFPASSKEKMLTLVGNLQKALGERINTLEWMGDSTKLKAQEKLAAFTVKIGYPDKWRDYSALEIKPDSYWANVRRSSIFEMEYMLADAGKPVDKSRWYMTPQTINAYYNPTTNEICFPAAILQPPFFDPEADDAINYGAIGVVIGHEMTHGFDDQGRNYDKEGNLADWWTSEDAARFTERANKLVAQYDNIIVLDTMHANGSFTLGENIADQGGLLISHQAYLNSLQGETPAVIDGFTGDQRFYLGYATLWAQNIRDEEIVRRTKMDPHSLGKWRVNAALKNIDTFYKAFDVKEGDAMYMQPADRVNIW